MFLPSWNTKSLRDALNNRECIDRCDGVIAQDPCDHVVVVAVSNYTNYNIVTFSTLCGFVLVNDSLGVGCICPERYRTFNFDVKLVSLEDR